MVPEAGTILSDKTNSRSRPSGSICLPQQSSTSTLLHQVPTKRNQGNRCTDISVAEGSTICIPSSSSDGQTSLVDSTLQSIRDCGHSQLASLTMVFHSPSDAHGSTISPSFFTRYIDPGASVAPPPRMVASDHMEVERRAFLDLGYSDKVTDTVLASQKDSTNRIYNVTWKAFYQWCRRKSVDVLHPSLNSILGFLQDGLKSGLWPTTLQKQVAALTSVLPKRDSTPISQHPHVCPFLRGASMRNPLPVHRFPSWCLHTVLSALTKHPFEPIMEIPLKWL